MMKSDGKSGITYYSNYHMSSSTVESPNQSPILNRFSVKSNQNQVAPFSGLKLRDLSPIPSPNLT